MDEKVLEITEQNGAAIFGFLATSISDAKGITAAGNQITEFIDLKQPRLVVFDFAKVKFFSSQVLGLLLMVRKKVKEYEGEVVISAIDPQLHRVFKITNLDKIFKFYSDRGKALVSD